MRLRWIDIVSYLIYLTFLGLGIVAGPHNTLRPIFESRQAYALPPNIACTRPPAAEARRRTLLSFMLLCLCSSASTGGG